MIREALKEILKAVKEIANRFCRARYLALIAPPPKQVGPDLQTMAALAENKKITEGLKRQHEVSVRKNFELTQKQTKLMEENMGLRQEIEAMKLMKRERVTKEVMTDEASDDLRNV